MKLVIGLGNPGAKYSDTKHNIGFIALDELAYQLGLAFNKSKFESVYAEGRIGSEKVLLIKPQTYMNDSGRSIRPWMDYYDLTEEDIVVVYDDMDLPAGKVRLRTKGSAGGHNGIKSLIQHIGTKEFNRIRIGVGRPYPSQSVVSHVLSGFEKEVHQDMLESVKVTADAVKYWSEGKSFQDTMTKFN
ncbi:aminoacyl-tRNA hydrolase [Marinilactibacillus sp. XAAS-LB27]|uniref:aminoacyl-tRNA hydrolase n=1 Tax=Marinilactibacillus sp. XAAS-LB27 TaxID=3114538 RepID=UPI002E189A73|nr:aminoacyl-tRNA hydrolase [Marinilactibacillus sp. XAAS-LB27]